VRGGVVELTTIFALDDFDGVAKLYGDISENIRQSEESVIFNVQERSPHKMGAIINTNQIIFVTRDANNLRGPQIIMY
jgi:hypothetical protein